MGGPCPVPPPRTLLGSDARMRASLCAYCVLYLATSQSHLNFSATHSTIPFRAGALATLTASPSLLSARLWCAASSVHACMLVCLHCCMQLRLPAALLPAASHCLKRRVRQAGRAPQCHCHLLPPRHIRFTHLALPPHPLGRPSAPVLQVRNNAGGLWNHGLFFLHNLAPAGSQASRGRTVNTAKWLPAGG